MTVNEAVDWIIALREVQKKTGCVTRRAQSMLLGSLPDDVLAEVAVRIKPILDKDNDNEPHSHKK